MISKALNDGQISQEEFKIVLDELDRYTDLKDKLHTKDSMLSEQEKKVNRRKKDKRHIIFFNINKIILINDPPPAY